ncbi:unnamed protein product, partial [Sphagnum jensenii]
MMFAFKSHITEWRLVILQAQEKIFVLQMKQPWRNLIGNSIQNQASRTTFERRFIINLQCNLHSFLSQYEEFFSCIYSSFL